MIAVFRDRRTAEDAVRALVDRGIDETRINLLLSHSPTAQELMASGESKAAEGAVTGGAIGGMLGAIAAGGLALPPLGLIAAGPLFAVFAGLTTGSVSGGLLGALVGLGIPENEAALRSEEIQEGATLVGIEAADARRLDDVKAVLGKHEPDRVYEVEAKEAREGDGA